MPKSREHLIHQLTEAAEIEHNLLCSYLYAAFSLKTGPADGLAGRQADAVARWHRSILSVAIEEMGHLAITSNLLIAVGATARFDRPNFPVAPGYHPAGFVIRLTPFNEATLKHFVFLERPEDAGTPDSREFRPEASYERVRPAAGITPSADDYDTIGAFYGSIRDGLVELVRQKGEAAFVDRRGQGQIGPDLAALPGLSIITDLPSALRALDTIVEQGEGASCEREDCHFARFSAIGTEWAELRRLDPGFEPAHPAASDPVMRKPANGAERVWITDPGAAERLDLANAVYGHMLALLEQAYAPWSPGSSRTFYLEAAMQLMHAVSSLGSGLARLPAGPEHPGVNAGMTFAVPRHLRPRPADHAPAVLLERLDELAAAHARLLPDQSDEAFAGARRSLQQVLATA